MPEALYIQVKGVVQGVGFRPFVFRLAQRYGVRGWVLNALEGVFIHAEAEPAALDAFVNDLHSNPPAAAAVKELLLDVAPFEGFEGFEIRFSDDAEAAATTLVSPDLATCEDCLAELFDPADRRYRYPFINCTNCGPRFTIIEGLPYDRANTSMKSFPMCDKCAAEYADPADRRFHAQPDACWECGPHVLFACRQTKGLDAAASSCTSSSPLFAYPHVQSTLGRKTNESDAQEKPSLTFSDYASKDGCLGTTETIADLGGDASQSGRRSETKRGWNIRWGKTREESDAIFAEAARMLLEGKILAVKGLGGFHLVCDATNAQALAELRRRKHRKGKAFAVMMRSSADVRRVCEVNAAEERLLSGTARPIVLLRKRAGAAFAPGLADRLPELGVMLPYTPVQHLLLHDFEEALRAERGADALAMLVMTSGNISGEPIVTDDATALQKLGHIADAVLGNNRDIRARYDDSVVRVLDFARGASGDDAATANSEVQAAASVGGQAAVNAEVQIAALSDDERFAVQFIRRARGYAPLPLQLKRQAPEANAAEANEGAAGEAAEQASGTTTAPLLNPDGSFAPAKAAANSVIFATGPEQKATLAFLRPGKGGAPTDVFVSQHIGDVEHAETYDAWLETKQRFEGLFQLKPGQIACDMHPEYLTTKWAWGNAACDFPSEPCDLGCGKLPLSQVQHHHAHIASVLGENDLFGPACGIAFDGTGYGADRNLWGGEVLLANQAAYERFANFAYVPMPGGAACIKHPLRMAYGALWEFDLLEHPAAAGVLQALGEQASLCDQMIEKGLNTPMTSSVGRLFDAASAILGVCTEPSYEGEPAILLEAALGEEARAFDASDAYPIDVIKNTATDKSTAQDTSVVLFDAAPAFKALLDDVAAGVAVPVIARRFHEAFVQAALMAAVLVNQAYGITTVALSGGVFMNRYLAEHAVATLTQAGFTVALNRDLPPNDGCISYGQCVVSYARI